MASAQQIGRGICPVCEHDKARFAVSVKNLVCMTCDSCNTQIFARSDRSDELLRKRIKTRRGEVTPETEDTPETVAKTAPENKPAPAPAPDPKPSWSFF